MKFNSTVRRIHTKQSVEESKKELRKQTQCDKQRRRIPRKNNPEGWRLKKREEIFEAISE